MNYITEYYNNKATFEKAEPVNVLGEAVVSGIDAALAVGGRITGTVTDRRRDGLRLHHRYRHHLLRQHEHGWRIRRDRPADGSAYKVEFMAEPEYALEYYNNKFSPLKATSVAVVAGATTSGINAALAP